MFLRVNIYIYNIFDIYTYTHPFVLPLNIIFFNPLLFNKVLGNILLIFVYSTETGAGHVEHFFCFIPPEPETKSLKSFLLKK